MEKTKVNISAKSLKDLSKDWDKLNKEYLKLIGLSTVTLVVIIGAITLIAVTYSTPSGSLDPIGNFASLTLTVFSGVGFAFTLTRMFYFFGLSQVMKINSRRCLNES